MNWERKATKQIKVGDVLVGGGAPVTVQSMTTTRTHQHEKTLAQINELAQAGCDLIRIACPTNKDADALSIICSKSPIPVIVDVHFQSHYVFKAIEAGAGAVRVNPGNIIRLDDDLKEIVAAAKANGVSLRIGVNAGSLDETILKKYNYKATPEALVEAAIKECDEFDRLGFYDYKVSVKHHDVKTVVETYRMLSSKIENPLHLGVTEAGPAFQGTVKSAAAFSILLAEGIGDTIRVSLSADPIEEVRVGREILQNLGLQPRELEIISCPTCGRKEADVIELAARVEKAFAGRPDLKKHPLRIAVMGCVVNGPGEAREADIGIASGRNFSELFIKGKVVEKVENTVAIEKLIERANQLIDKNDI